MDDCDGASSSETLHIYPDQLLSFSRSFFDIRSPIFFGGGPDFTSATSGPAVTWQETAEIPFFPLNSFRVNERTARAWGGWGGLYSIRPPSSFFEG